MNVRRILCPTDFSETSAHAVEQAAAIAGYYKASILALHVYQPIDAWVNAESVDGLLEQTAAVFEGVTKAGVKLDVAVDVGSPVHHILNRAANLPADLIVMGTHGASGFEHLVLGSITEKVLRKAPCPVLTVPPRLRSQSRLPFQRLLCATDFSDTSASAVRFALSLARESGACLTLLHVLEWPWHEPPQPRIEELPPEQGFALAMFRRDAETRARQQLELLVPQPRSRVRIDVVSGTPYEQVLAIADRDKSDLIVLGVGRRSALNLTLLGSTANHVVRAAACPVLTLRDRTSHTEHRVHEG
jgi:nucleotide-binding universal stress UspA family protein